MLFSLQGKILIGARLPSGKAGVLYWVGNVPEATIALATETTDKTESFSGNRLSYGRLQTSKSGTINLTLDEWSKKNLGLGLYGLSANTVGGSVTAETFPAGLVAGDLVRLARPYASALVITDSAGTPATVPAGNYSLGGHNTAVVEILNPGAFVQPFKAAYTYAAYDSLDAFTQPAPERFVIFDGINTETGTPVLVDLYRVRFDPISELPLINAEYGALPMAGAVLYDALNDDGSVTGGFLRITEKTPV